MAVAIFIIILAYFITGIVRNALYICKYCAELEDRKEEVKPKKKLIK